MIGADHLVAVRDTSPLAQEQCTIVLHGGKRLPRLPGQNLDVFGGESISHGERLLNGVYHQNLAVVPPSRAGEVAGRHVNEKLVDVRLRLPGNGRAGRDEYRRGIRSVFGLAEQVDGHYERIGGVIGDDQDFRRTREQIDTYFTEQLAFGL